MISLARTKNDKHIAEIVGVIANAAYTWMYLKGMLPEAYGFAALGGIALGWSCWRNNLQAETALHLFYVCMAGYGTWYASSADGSGMTGSIVQHAAGLGVGLVSWALVVPVLRSRGSSMPRLDGFTTVFSIVATWWMVRWDPTNWLYWIVIDLVSIYLYAKRGMPWAAFLFAVYTIMAIDGWFQGIQLF